MVELVVRRYPYLIIGALSLAPSGDFHIPGWPFKLNHWSLNVDMIELQ